MTKRISLMLVALFVAIILAVAMVCVAKPAEEKKAPDFVPSLITASDIYIPKGMKESNFGLFFFDGEGNRVRSTDDGVPFDDAKPVIIFSHGSSLGYGIDYPELFSQPERWIDAGYNVGEFIWSQISDDDPFASELKVWTREAISFARYPDGQTSGSVMERTDTPKYSMAETFVAYYLDFMKGRNFTGREIHFEGLSLGAQLTFANCSYLFALEKAGLIGEEFLPDRVTIFDAFLTNVSFDETIPWLNEPIGKKGSLQRAKETGEMMIERGIAFEYVASSPVEITAMINSDEADKNAFADMTAPASRLDYVADWISPFALNDLHCIGKAWFNTSISFAPIMDATLTVSDDQYALGANTPTSYTYARRGTKYAMKNNPTLESDDDLQYSQNIDCPMVAGFCFADENGDGNYNERLKSRVGGLMVSLFTVEGDKETLVATATVGDNGYYEIPIEPIFFTGRTAGRSFVVKVTDLDGREITSSKGTEDYVLMRNDVNANGASDVFVMYKKGDLKIINIGLK